MLITSAPLQKDTNKITSTLHFQHTPLHPASSSSTWHRQTKEAVPPCRTQALAQSLRQHKCLQYPWTHRATLQTRSSPRTTPTNPSSSPAPTTSPSSLQNTQNVLLPTQIQPHKLHRARLIKVETSERAAYTTTTKDPMNLYPPLYPAKARSSRHTTHNLNKTTTAHKHPDNPCSLYKISPCTTQCRTNITTEDRSRSDTMITIMPNPMPRHSRGNIIRSGNRRVTIRGGSRLISSTTTRMRDRRRREERRSRLSLMISII